VSRYAGKAISRRLASPSDIVQIFGDICQKTVQWLPLSQGVVAVGTDADGHKRYLVVRPAKRTRIRCEVGKRVLRMTVAMPNLLAELVAGKKGWRSIAAVYAFSGKASGLKDSTSLYVAPLPNIYKNGSVCMGSVDIKRWAKLPASKAFEEAFIKTPFTDHLLTEPLAKMGKKAKWRNILHALQETKGKVPLRELVKVKAYGEIFKN